MRKWQPYAPNGTPGVWYNVQCFIPTVSGSYVTQPVFATASFAGPSTPGTTRAAWATLIQSGAAVGYVGTTTKLYTFNGNSTFTDKSKAGGYTSTATDWGFAQYGNITIACNGVDATQFRDASGSGAFADLTGAPIAHIAVAQSNVILLFNTSTNADGWAASDVGDYTNWTTGESASGQLLQTPGPVTAAIAFGGVVIVFKKNSVYRMQYVGGSVKWTVELLTGARGAWGANDVVSCGDVLVFSGPGGAWKFDGSSFVGITDYLGEITTSGNTVAGVYSPWSRNAFFCQKGGTGKVYNTVSDRWGAFSGVTNSNTLLLTAHVPFRGSPEALNALLAVPANSNFSRNGLFYVDPAASNPTGTGILSWGSGATLETALLTSGVEGAGGRRITSFLGIDLEYTSSSYALSADIVPSNTALSVDVYTAQSLDGYNLIPSNSGATIQGTYTSSSNQRRFDFSFSDVYARFNFRLANGTGQIEVSDYSPIMKPGGLY